MTFSARHEILTTLIPALRQDLPATYEAIPGFCGLLVLEKPGTDHVLAITLWEGERGLDASEHHARDYARTISKATGAEVSHSTYQVIGSIMTASAGRDTEC